MPKPLKTSATLLLVGLLTACQAADPPPRDDFDRQLAGKLPTASFDTRQKVRTLLKNAVANFAFVEGGTFTMGDWGAVGEDGVWRPYFPPLAKELKAHQVTLSSYSLSKYETTWLEYDTFLLATNRPTIVRANIIGASLGGTPFIIEESEREPFAQDPEDSNYIKNPARDRWQDAKDYCTWLGEMTGLPVDLPTDAQFEYAARNRGEKWLFASHDGKPIDSFSDPYAEVVYGGADVGPVGSRLPPNPLGLYDMGENEREWVNDWYSPTYFSEHPEITDPQGPPTGTEKIERSLGVGSLAFSFGGRGMPEKLDDGYIVTSGFRCAVNSSKPIAVAIPD